MAAADGKYFGTKIYSSHPKHGAHFLFLLYALADAKPLAILEANYLGQLRTGAASGYATKLLARADAQVVGLIGGGFQSRNPAYGDVRRSADPQSTGLEQIARKSAGLRTRMLQRTQLRGRGRRHGRASRSRLRHRNYSHQRQGAGARRSMDRRWHAHKRHGIEPGPNAEELPSRADLQSRPDCGPDSLEQACMESGDLPWRSTRINGLASTSSS